MHSESQESPEQPEKLEIVNQVANHIKHLIERFKNRSTPSNLRLSEGYVNKKLHVLIHFQFRDSEQFVACFERENPPLRIQDRATDIVGGGSAVEFGDPLPVAFGGNMSLECGHGSEQQSVFVKIAETGKAVENLTVPTAVRFESIYSFYSVRPHARYYSLSTGFVVGEILSGWKQSIPMGSDLTSSDACQMPTHMVQRGPQIVQDITQDNRKSQRDILYGDDIKLALSRLRIYLGTKSIRVFTEESVALGLQVNDVLLGPFDF